ncbi:unnamed protein product [marine sediment metagenome]|uniref:Uncharacterized protein n=1 Tax=marine sediment metagenome TaxID=412755 RepID=X0S5M0_9ZZZZ
MICNCGGNTENTHKVVRDKVLQGEYQKCPNCGRILWLWKTDLLEKEIKDYSKSLIDGFEKHI